MKVLVTGAMGFIGTELISGLLDSGHKISAIVRELSDLIPAEVKQIVLEDLSLLSEKQSSISLKNNIEFSGAECVVHLAARVHVMNEHIPDPLLEFRKVNSVGTLALARLASEVGAKRFVFLSSIKVNGEATELGTCFSHDDVKPTDPYGLSKYEAEQGLLALGEETGMEIVIIRPSLVYGPGVKANFASMIKWVNRGVPFPFGAVHNKRSLIALDNLVSFIIHCINHPKAANEVFLISDGEDISTTELLKKVSKAFGKRSLLIPVPVWLMTLIAKLIGKEDMANRLFGSLQVDSSKARDLLSWKPVITMDEQLKKISDAT